MNPVNNYPTDIDEAAVIASLILYYDDALKEGADQLQVEHFSSLNHRTCFEVIDNLRKDNVPITAQSVINALKAKFDVQTIERIVGNFTRLDKIATHVQRVIDAKLIADKELGKITAIHTKLWQLSQEKIGTTELNRKSASAVVEWLHRRGKFYFHKDHRDFASVMFFDSERKMLLPVQNQAFLAWLSDSLSINRAERTFEFIKNAIEVEGLSERATGIVPSTYWASKEDYIYLSCGAGRMAKIGADGVNMVDNGDGALFPYASTLPEWKYTKEGIDPFESCSLFRDMATSALHGKHLFQSWAISLPTDLKCKPPLCVTGDVGSGKTRTIRGLFELFGIPERISAVVRNGESDFWTAQDAGGLVCFDNADTRIDWLPDALSTASTGGCHMKRKLYTDTDSVIQQARAWTAVTSASPSFASDAGLADRLLVVRLNRRQDGTADGRLSEEIATNRCAGLSWICQTLSKALADQTSDPCELNKRHPDFASFAVKIGRAIGMENEYISALRSAEMDKSNFALENDQIGSILLEVITEEFEGTAQDLLSKIILLDPAVNGQVSAKMIGKRLRSLWPHIEGVFNAQTWKDSHSKTMKYRLTPKSADHAEFKTPFPINSLCEDKCLYFAESSVPNTANSAIKSNHEMLSPQKRPFHAYNNNMQVLDRKAS